MLCVAKSIMACQLAFGCTRLRTDLSTWHQVMPEDGGTPGAPSIVAVHARPFL